VLSCAVMCCAGCMCCVVLCCDVLCCAELFCDVLYCAVLLLFCWQRFEELDKDGSGTLDQEVLTSQGGGYVAVSRGVLEYICCS
jgi:hypothetical protein